MPPSKRGIAGHCLQPISASVHAHTIIVFFMTAISSFFKKTTRSSFIHLFTSHSLLLFKGSVDMTVTCPVASSKATGPTLRFHSHLNWKHYSSSRKPVQQEEQEVGYPIDLIRT